MLGYLNQFLCRKAGPPSSVIFAKCPLAYCPCKGVTRAIPAWKVESRLKFTQKALPAKVGCFGRSAWPRASCVYEWRFSQ